MPRRSIALAAGLLLSLMISKAIAEEILLTIPRPLGGAQLEFFGRAVANVGDQNGDGFDDFLVGMPAAYLNNTNDVGHAFLYYGGSVLDDQYELVITGEGLEAKLGYSVTGLGDFNADGFPDFAVGEPGCTGSIGAKVHVFFGGPGLDDQAELIMGGPYACTWFGRTVTGGRDLNGDGYPDLAAAALADDTGTASTGRIYVYFGGPDVDDQADLILDGLPGDLGFGLDVKSVDDVTGDGYPDLLALTNEPGRVMVFAGGPGLDGFHDWAVDIPSGGSNQVAGGDLDADGAADILVGVPFGTPAGEVLVYRGGAGLDAAVDLTLTGRKDGEGFGRMVEAPGDFDGDGVVDLVIGAEGAYPNHLRGYMYLYRGGDLGAPVLDLVMGGPGQYDRFGFAAASLGDIDLDGDDELLVGSTSPYGYVWVVDELFLDCDDDDVSDFDQLAGGELPDCDADGIPDPCQILLWPNEECNRNGHLDACEIATVPELDCDGNGGIDACQILAEPIYDCDGDGEVDLCTIAVHAWMDCDENGVLDVCDIAQSPESDCDGDGQYDGCEIANNPHEDDDDDGVLDVCQFPGELALYADPAHTINNIDMSESGVAGPFELVLHLPAGAPPVSRVELEITASEQLLVTSLQPVPPFAYDADGRLIGLVLYLEPQLPDPEGEILLARVWCFVQSGAAVSQELAITANLSGAGTPGFVDPLWVDDGAEVRLILATRSGWINRGFTDCNGNGLPDDEDILEGRADDWNGNGVPDECELTAAPPREARWRLAIDSHPNPFNPVTTLRLEFPRSGAASVEIIDVAGRTVRTFTLTAPTAGPHQIQWRGTDDRGCAVASGVYIARLVQGRHVVQGKLALLR
jgi:hypothetical protein